MVIVHAGATLDRLPGPKYLAALHFCELALEPPLPRVATLADWREALPGPVDLAFVAPPACVTGPGGALRLDEALGDAIEWMTDAAAAVGARHLVVPTPPAVSPGARSRERLEAYVARLRAEAPDIALVWEPSGPWELSEAQAFGRAIGVAVALDPLHGEPAPETTIYARLEALGSRPRFTDGLLEDLLDRLDALGAREARVALRSARSFQEASRLQAIADARGG